MSEQREWWIVEEVDRYPSYPHDAYDAKPFDGAICVVDRSAYDQAIKERDSLNAEVERLRDGYKYLPEGFVILKERDALKAQVERLNESLETERELNFRKDAIQWQDEALSFRATSEKLAEALERIDHEWDAVDVTRVVPKENDSLAAGSILLAKQVLAEYRKAHPKE